MISAMQEGLAAAFPHMMKSWASSARTTSLKWNCRKSVEFYESPDRRRIMEMNGQVDPQSVPLLAGMGSETHAD